jgi:hypothetical protein
MVECPVTMVDDSTIDAQIFSIDGGRLHHRCPNFRYRWWARPVTMPEFPVSMVDVSSIDARISGIDARGFRTRVDYFFAAASALSNVIGRT